MAGNAAITPGAWHGSRAGAQALARGGRDDPQYGEQFPLAPVQATRTVADGEGLRLGDLALAAHATPGHTKDNTTLTWKSCEDTRCPDVVHVGSLSAPDYRLIGTPGYPEIVKDCEHSCEMVAALPCDIALAPHPGMVASWERVAKRDQGDAEALMDRTPCRTYAKDARESFAEEVTRQRKAAASSRQRRP